MGTVRSYNGCLLDTARVSQAFEGRYAIDACLGGGSRGEAFGARPLVKEGGGARVAIKFTLDTPLQRIAMEPEARCKQSMTVKRYSPHPEHFCECFDYGRVTIGADPYMYIVNSVAPGRSILDIGLGSPVEPPPEFPTLASIVDAMLEVVDIMVASEEGFLVEGQLVRHIFDDVRLANVFISRPGVGVTFMDIDSHDLCTSSGDAPNPFGFRVVPICRTLGDRVIGYRGWLLTMLIHLMRYQHDHRWVPRENTIREGWYQLRWHPALRGLTRDTFPGAQARDSAVAAMAEQLRPAYAPDYSAAVGSAMFRAPASDDFLYEFRTSMRDARALLR